MIGDMPLVERMAFVLHRGGSESRWRAIARTEDPEGWYAIALTDNNRKKLPAWFSLEDLQRARNAKGLRPLNPTEDIVAAGPRALSLAAQRDMEDAWKMVEIVLRDHAKFLDADTRFAYLKDLSDKYGFSRDTVLERMARYHRRGCTKWAVAPHHSSRGVPKVAGPRQTPRTAKHVITPGEHERLGKYVEASNSTGRGRMSAGTIYEQMAADASPATSMFPSGIEASIDHSPSPQKHQVEYQLKKARATPAMKAKRLTARQLASQYKAKTGSAGARAVTTYEVLELDGKHASEIKGLRHPLSLEIKLPPLMLWIGMDVASGSCAGVVPDFRSESAAGMKAALYGMFAGEKNSRWDRYIGPLRPYETRVYRTIRGDRIVRSYASDALVEELGVSIDTVPPNSPEEKPFVESFNQWLPEALLRGRPGVLFADENERGLEPLPATYSLTELMVAIISTVRKFDQAPVSAKQLPAGARSVIDHLPSRSELLNLGPEPYGQAHLPVELDHLRRVLLPCGEAYVKSDAIEFHGLRFTCATALAQQWFTRLKGRPKKLTVYWDPLCVSRVWWDKGNSGPLEPLELLSGQEDLADLHVVELELWLERERHLKAQAEKRRLGAAALNRKQLKTIDKLARSNARAQRDAERAMHEAAVATPEPVPSVRRVDEETEQILKLLRAQT